MAALVVLLAQQAIAQTPRRDFANPSLLALIVTPDRFEGKSIVTTGVVRVEHEGFRIYVSREDAEHRIIENSVRFDPSGSAVPIAEMKRLNLEYAQIGGTWSLEPNPDESGARVGVVTRITLFRAR